jgi:hypothetical protein
VIIRALYMENLTPTLDLDVSQLNALELQCFGSTVAQVQAISDIAVVYFEQTSSRIIIMNTQVIPLLLRRGVTLRYDDNT